MQASQLSLSMHAAAAVVAAVVDRLQSAHFGFIDTCAHGRFVFPVPSGGFVFVKDVGFARSVQFSTPTVSVIPQP